MGKVLAITGKGGVGKTTVSALAVQLLVASRQGPVLAVDADPNLNLNAALGIAVEETVGDVREEGRAQTAALSGGLAKSEFLRLRVQQALVEQQGFDLLAMGRPEGPGCYCYANSVLRGCVDQIGRHYAFVIVDCEAGLEHLSRRTAGEMSCLLVLSDPSLRAVETARRVLDLVDDLGTRVEQVAFGFTRVRGQVPSELLRAVCERGLPAPYVIPDDPELTALEAQGRPLTEVSPDSPARRATQAVLESLGLLPVAAASWAP